MNKLQRWILHTFFKPTDITGDSQIFEWLYPRGQTTEGLLYTLARITEMTYEIDDPDKLEMSFSLSSKTQDGKRKREMQAKVLSNNKPILFHCDHVEEDIE